MLGQYLTNEGFDVVTATDGLAAEEKAADPSVDLIILDIMMPRKNGFAVLSEIRRTRATPILILTACGEDADSVFGLEMGADDYIAKPCSPQVLSARVRALLRRSEPRVADPTIDVGDVALNVQTRSVTCGGRSITLTATECRLLEILLRQAGRTVTRELLTDNALGRSSSRSERTLDMHISNLRQKLDASGDGKERIKTVWGLGYQFTAS